MLVTAGGYVITFEKMTGISLLPFSVVVMWHLHLIPHLICGLSNTVFFFLIFFHASKHKKALEHKEKITWVIDTCFVLIIIQTEVDFEVSAKSVIFNICYSS